jgi:hypothetical protein
MLWSLSYRQHSLINQEYITWYCQLDISYTPPKPAGKKSLWPIFNFVSLLISRGRWRNAPFVMHATVPPHKSLSAKLRLTNSIKSAPLSPQPDDRQRNYVIKHWNNFAAVIGLKGPRSNLLIVIYESGVGTTCSSFFPVLVFNSCSKRHYMSKFCEDTLWTSHIHTWH